MRACPASLPGTITICGRTYSGSIPLVPGSCCNVNNSNGTWGEWSGDLVNVPGDDGGSASCVSCVGPIINVQNTGGYNINCAVFAIRCGDCRIQWTMPYAYTSTEGGVFKFVRGQIPLTLISCSPFVLIGSGNIHCNIGNESPACPNDPCGTAGSADHNLTSCSNCAGSTIVADWGPA